MSVRDFAQKLRALPVRVAIAAAAAAAPVLTELVRGSTSASSDPYGVAWPASPEGRAVTLRKSGAMLSSLRYVAIGTRLRLALTTSYAKYQVGRRPVAPAQGALLPPAYAQALAEIARDAVKRGLS